MTTTMLSTKTHVSLTFELEPVNASQVHLHVQQSARSRRGRALEGPLQIGAPAGHLHDRLHEDAVLAAPHQAVVTALVVHCAPGPPVNSRLHHHQRVQGSG